MTGRVFTKLLLSFLLVLSVGTAILDFSVRHILERSLARQVEGYYRAKAAGMARQLAAAAPGALPGIVQAQAVAARADISVVDRRGAMLAEALGAFAPPGGLDSLAGSPEQLPSLQLSLPAGANTARFRFSLTALADTLKLLRRDLLLASLLALLLATVTAALLARRAARRLQRIVRFAHRIAAGELSARVEEGRLDEISEVAHALDATAARLEASFRALDGSRRELAALLDSMQEAVIGVSPGSHVTWSNSKLRALAAANVRQGRALVECIRDPEVLRCVEVALGERALGRGRATSFLPGRVFAVSAAPMPGGGAVVVLHDVTEAERGERMRRDFVANVSHELRTPLTSITGYVETVLDDPELSPQSREFLGVVLRNATRMNRLTMDLLALATVEAGDFHPRLRAVGADALLEDAMDALGGMGMELGLAVENAGAPPVPVLADLDALHQVFGNLLENAMKYGRAGGRVRVGAREAGDAVEFSVRDWGPGIASEHLHRIFERFYRVDKARSRESGGTGLGLAIAKHIVLAHGGAIWAESELGHGVTFFFTLPRAAGHAAERDAESKALLVQ